MDWPDPGMLYSFGIGPNGEIRDYVSATDHPWDDWLVDLPEPWYAEGHREEP